MVCHCLIKYYDDNDNNAGFILCVRDSDRDVRAKTQYITGLN